MLTTARNFDAIIGTLGESLELCSSFLRKRNVAGTYLPDVELASVVADSVQRVDALEHVVVGLEHNDRIQTTVIGVWHDATVQHLHEHTSWRRGMTVQHLHERTSRHYTTVPYFHDRTHIYLACAAINVERPNSEHVHLVLILRDVT